MEYIDIHNKPENISFFILFTTSLEGDLSMKYDVIIVGAGTGGCVTALTLGKSGLRVAILDSKRQLKIGDKVCGDFIDPAYFRKIRDMGIDLKDPEYGKIVVKKLKGFVFIPPIRKNMLKLDLGSERWVLDRHVFGQSLLRNVIDEGVDLIDQCKVVTPIVEKNVLRGVTVKHKGEKKNIQADVCVDASGYHAVIRKQLDPQKTYMERNILDKDTCLAYREIRTLTTDIDYSDYSHLIFDPDNVPGGFIWVIPREERVVNVGLGVHLGLKRPPKLRKLFDKVLENNPIFRGSTVIKAGGWRIPLRRPIDTCVWNNLLLVGDAGSHVKPTDGEGIGFSMQAGVMAGNAIVRAHDLGSFSKDNLWQYNVHIMKAIGVVNGPLELGKRKIINLTSKEVQKLFDSSILDAEELYQLNSGNKLNFGTIEMIKKLWKGKKVLTLLLSLRKTIKNMKKSKRIYLEYPESFDGFPKWKKKIERLYG